MDWVYFDLEELIDSFRQAWGRHSEFLSNPSAFTHVRKMGEEQFFNCPYHSESTPSCSIMDHPPYAFHCFGCGASGTVGKMAAHVFAFSSELQGYHYLLNNFILVESIRPTLDIEHILDKPNKQPSSLLEEELNPYRGKLHSYILQRGLSERTLLKYEVGYDEERGCITFPVRHTDGQLRFIQRRSVFGKHFGNEKGVSKKDIVYGLYYLADKGIDEVYLTESIIDTLSCYEAKLPACAVMGSRLYPEQVRELLRAGIKKVHLFFDNDNAGRMGIREVQKGNYPLLFDVVVYPDRSKDANELLLEGKMPQISVNTFVEYQLRRG